MLAEPRAAADGEGSPLEALSRRWAAFDRLRKAHGKAETPHGQDLPPALSVGRPASCLSRRVRQLYCYDPAAVEQFPPDAVLVGSGSGGSGGLLRWEAFGRAALLGLPSDEAADARIAQSLGAGPAAEALEAELFGQAPPCSHLTRGLPSICFVIAATRWQRLLPLSSCHWQEHKVFRS